jgi:hypothetical protein
MSSNDTPTDPQALRAEIARTRADLGATVEALAAKTDVTGRAKDAVADFTDQAKAKLRGLRDQAGDVADTVAGQVRSGTDSVRESVADMDVKEAVRRPLPVAAIATVVVLVGVVVWWVRRRRH